MKQDIETRLAALKEHLALSARERASLRAKLLMAIRPSPSPFYFSRRFLAPVALSLVMAVSAVGSIALAASNTVPGDFLYAIKLNVDEKVKGAFAISTQAKADLNAALAEERLKETAKLTERGTLTPAARANLQENLGQHLAALSTDVATLKAEGDTATVSHLATQVDAAINVHAASLRALGVDVSIKKSVAEPVPQEEKDSSSPAGTSPEASPATPTATTTAATTTSRAMFRVQAESEATTSERTATTSLWAKKPKEGKRKEVATSSRPFAPAEAEEGTVRIEITF